MTRPRRSRPWPLVLLALIAALPARSQQDRGPSEYFPPEPGFEDVVTREREGEVSVGFAAADGSGGFLQASGLSGGRAGEYRDDGESLYLAGRLRLQGEQALLRAAGVLLSPDEALASAALDLGRRLVSKSRFSRFLHRLDHDPLANNRLPPPRPNDGVVNGFNPAEVTVDFFDADPDGVAAIRRTELTADNRYHLRPGVELVGEVRLEHRSGSRFARTLDNAHESGGGLTPCQSCHVRQQLGRVDQLTRDLRLGAILSRGRLTVETGYLHRQFEDSSERLELAYGNPDRTDPDKAGKRFPVRRPHAFDGVSEFAHVPDSKKDLVEARARFDATPEHTLSAHGAYARTRNRHLDAPTTLGFTTDPDNERYVRTTQGHHDRNVGRGVAEVWAGGGSYTGRFRALRVDARARLEDYSTDIEGSGEMLADLERRTLSLSASASAPLVSSRVRLRGLVEYLERDRGDWFVPTTERWRGRGEIDFRPDRRFSAYLRYRHERTDDPFANPPDAAKRARGAEDLLFAFGATNQFLQTSQPGRADDLRLGAKWSPTPRLSLQGMLHGLRAENDDVDLDHDAWTAGATAWLSLPGRSFFTTAYTFHQTEIVADLYFGDAISFVPDFATDPDTVIPVRGPTGRAILDIFRAKGVPYESDSHDLSLSLETEALRVLRLAARLRWGRHEQSFALGETAELVFDEAILADRPRLLQLPGGIAALSALDIEQVGVSLELEVPVRPALKAFVHGSFEDYRDRAEDRPVIVRGSSDFYLLYAGLRFGF